MNKGWTDGAVEGEANAARGVYAGCARVECLGDLGLLVKRCRMWDWDTVKAAHVEGIVDGVFGPASTIERHVWCILVIVQSVSLGHILNKESRVED